MSKLKIARLEKFGVATVRSGSYSFEIAGDYKVANPGILPLNVTIRNKMPLRIGSFDIIPNGESNTYPYEIREIMDENNLIEELLSKKAKLLWGQGPALFRTEIKEGNTIRRVWLNDTDIENWLRGINYEDYLLNVITDIRVMNSYFDKIRLTLGSRIGLPPKIATIEYVDYADCRLEWNNLNMPERIIVGDFLRPWITGLTSFPKFNSARPFSAEVAMNYNSLPQFLLRKEYARASFHGAINWIKNASTVAKLLLALNINFAAIKMHLKIPAVIIDKKREEIRARSIESAKQLSDREIQDEIDNYVAAVIDTVTGSGNVGKLLYTTDVYDDEAQEYASVKIEPIDLKIKDYIDAQINIAKRAAFETTAGVGLHAAMSNITHEGNLPSGSEQLYAYKLFLNTDIDIIERLAVRTINTAIRLNWPDKNVKLGFYHNAVLAESEVTPDKRTKNIE